MITSDHNSLNARPLNGIEQTKGQIPQVSDIEFYEVDDLHSTAVRISPTVRQSASGIGFNGISPRRLPTHLTRNVRLIQIHWQPLCFLFPLFLNNIDALE